MAEWTLHGRVFGMRQSKATQWIQRLAARVAQHAVMWGMPLIALLRLYTTSWRWQDHPCRWRHPPRQRCQQQHPTHPPVYHDGTE
jgi:hypothetical protein